MKKVGAKQKTSLIPVENIERKILLIRGVKVMIDTDIAEFYGVTTKVLNQAVKRNKDRFPADFMFQLSGSEKEEVVTNCDHLTALKFSHKLPYTFTEHGVMMLSSVLKSDRAVEMGLLIVRTFIKMREVLATHKDLAYKFNELVRIQVNQGNPLTLFLGPVI